MSSNDFIMPGIIKLEKEEEDPEDEVVRIEDDDWEDLRLVAIVDDDDDDESGTGRKRVQKRKGYTLKNPMNIFCRSLVSDPHNVTCSECGLHMKLFTRGALHIHRLTLHAGFHLGKKLFTCRMCDYGSVSPSAIRNHIMKVHKLQNNIISHYIDSSGDYQKELMEVLRRCFGEKRVFSRGRVTEEKRKDIRMEHKIHSITRGNALHVDKLMFCLQLLRKYKTDDGKIRCQVCDKDISATRHDAALKSDKALRHALIHLGKPMYACRRCKKTTVTVETMQIHLRQKHNIKSKSFQDKIEDNSDVYHDEALRVLTECYEPKDAGPSIDDENSDS